MSTLIRTLSRFRRDRSGNIAMIFGLALLPLMIAVGCAVDYSRANQIRSKLISAADAASVGSVARGSPGFIAAGAMTSDGEITAASLSKWSRSTSAPQRFPRPQVSGSVHEWRG